LDHTVRRIFQTFDLTENFHFFEKYVKAKLIFKRGTDGSSGQTEYHQGFTQNTHFIQNDQNLNSDHDDDLEEFDEQNIEYIDANMFLFSLVPLRLTFTASDSTNDIL
jgi:hypothetical protein